MNFLTVSEMRTEALKKNREKAIANLKTAPACIQKLVKQEISRINAELKRRKS